MKEETIVGRGFSRRKKAFGLMLLVIAGLAALLYFEQVALIYVLATFGLVVLLLVVAFADLEKVGREDEIEPAAAERAVQDAVTKKADKERRKAAGF